MSELTAEAPAHTEVNAGVERFDHVAIAVRDADRWLIVSAQDASDIRGPRWQASEARSDTVEFLERAAAGTGVSDRLTAFPVGRPPVRVIAAAADVGPGCVLLAYRAEAGVFRNLHRAMGLATALCAIAALGSNPC